jgi:competence protein ComEA
MDRKPAWVRPLVAAVFALAVAFAGATRAAAEDAAVSGVVNVNTASVEELQLLPGVGEARARAIVDMRTKKGGFKSVDELVEVKGIGPSGLEKLRPHLTVTGKTTARSE